MVDEPTREELIERLNPDLKQWVLDNPDSIVLPGKNPDKPVVRNAKGQVQKGSGIVPNHNDMAIISKKFAYKRRRSYRAALEEIIDADGPPDQRGTFLWWLNRAMEAAEGAPVEATCPECKHRFKVENVKKDGTLIFKIIEMMHGKATETKEVTYKDETMEEILRHRAESNAITVWDPDKDVDAKVRIIESE